MVYVDLKVQSPSSRLLVVESYKFIYVETVVAACGCLTLLQGAQKKTILMLTLYIYIYIYIYNHFEIYILPL